MKNECIIISSKIQQATVDNRPPEAGWIKQMIESVFCITKWKFGQQEPIKRVNIKLIYKVKYKFQR